MEFIDNPEKKLKEIDSPEIIIKILEEKFPNIKFSEKFPTYNLVMNLQDEIKGKRKEVPGKINEKEKIKVIKVNSKFDSNHQMIIFLHECLHFVFYNNNKELRKDLLPKFFCSEDEKESANNFEIYKDCEDLIIKYITYILLLKNLNKIKKSKEDLRDMLKNIEGLLDDNNGERYFYPERDWFLNNKSNNNLTDPDKFRLICLSLYYGERVELFDNLCSIFKDNMPDIRLAIKEIINKF